MYNQHDFTKRSRNNAVRLSGISDTDLEFLNQCQRQKASDGVDIFNPPPLPQTTQFPLMQLRLTSQFTIVVCLITVGDMWWALRLSRCQIRLKSTLRHQTFLRWCIFVCFYQMFPVVCSFPLWFTYYHLGCHETSFFPKHFLDQGLWGNCTDKKQNWIRKT